jgi:integrase
MAPTALSRSKTPTKIPQLSLAEGGEAAPANARARRAPRGGAALVNGDLRRGTRGEDRVVVEVAGGVTVYPARHPGDRWRAVWYENGRRRQCEAATEEGLAATIEKITARLAADAPGLERPGADLIAHYQSPGRLPAGRPWSRKHTDTQRRLCARYLAPVIGRLVREDIKTGHMQAVVNAAPTAGEGARVRRCISALVSAGLAGGYLLSPRLREVHWQAAGRPAPVPAVSIAGETTLFVDPADIPAHEDVTRLGRALAVLSADYELMACFAAYTGLRWGEIAALTTAQVDQDTRTVTVDRKVIEIGGQLYVEAPKGRKMRRTIYPRRTPAGYLLADKLAARITQAAAEQEAGTNPLGLIFCSPRGKHWRSSNFARRVLAPAYLSAGWRELGGSGDWTWHSLRHVFCTTALFTWTMDPADVSRLAGHASIRITLDMYIGATAGTLDRARTATQ